MHSDGLAESVRQEARCGTSYQLKNNDAVRRDMLSTRKSALPGVLGMFGQYEVLK
jgi:hypothetical protein